VHKNQVLNFGTVFISGLLNFGLIDSRRRAHVINFNSIVFSDFISNKLVFSKIKKKYIYEEYEESDEESTVQSKIN